MTPPLEPKKPREFIKLIRDELDGGGRLTPFLGSGISAQSGIIMGQDFPDYLAYVLWMVVKDKWDVRHRGWPPHPSSKDVDDVYDYWLKCFRKLPELRAFYIEEETDCATSETNRLQGSNAAPATPKCRVKIERITYIGFGNDIGRDNGLAALDAQYRRPLVPEILRGGDLWYKEQTLDEARKALKIEDRPWDLNMPASSEEYILECALRSLSHWTRTLEFLSRVVVTAAPPTKLYLDEPDNAVIDNFNAFITQGKRPNLIHNMVSRLTRSMRSNLVLTTNFDTLMEQSYRAQGEQLHVLAVSIRGGLPSFATVWAQDCLVKLHGDILETRADTSINEPPTTADMERFFQYLRGPGTPDERQPSDFVPSQLLVLGYSAGDARCVQMIRFVLDMDSDFRVYWVCHTPGDVAKVQRIFGSYLEKGQVIIRQTDRSDLLLWELYQNINLCLPGGGQSIQFSQFVPADHSGSPAVPPSTDAEIKEKSLAKLYSRVRATTNTQCAVISNRAGTAIPAEDLFRRWRKDGFDTLWLEMEDFRNVDDCFFHLLSAVSLHKGHFQLEWINFVPRRDENTKRMEWSKMLLRLDLLIEKFKINPERWVLFFYARNGPGGCTGWKHNYWKQDELEYFELFLHELTKRQFRVIYMPRSAKRNRRDAAKLKITNMKAKRLLERLDQVDWQPPNDVKEHPLFMPTTQPLAKADKSAFADLTGEVPSAISHPKFLNILDKVFKDFTPDPKDFNSPSLRSARTLWLYGLTLFRQSRHPAAMISEAVFPCPWRFHFNEGGAVGGKDNDEARHRIVYQGDPTAKHKPERDGWFQTLENAGVFLKKPGGYAWKYRDTRLALQFVLEQIKDFQLYDEPLSAMPRPGNKLTSLKSVRARLHYWIGDWYLRAFYATAHYLPLIEAIYHSAQAIIYAPYYHLREGVPSDEVAYDRARLTWMAICQLRRLLLVGRKSLLFWCPGVDLQSIHFDDLSLLEVPIDKVINDLEVTNIAKGAKLSRKLSQYREHIMKAEFEHLNDAVLSEGYANGGRTAPILGYPALIKADRPYSVSPDQRIEKVEPANQDANWMEDIVVKLNTGVTKASGTPLTAAEMATIINGLLNGDSSAFADFRFKWLKHWAIHGGDDGMLFQTIWHLSELMYRIVRRAKLEYHSARINGTLDHSLEGVPRLCKVRQRWQTVCSIAYSALQMARNLAPDFHNADCDLRIRILTLYGVALGYLNRFTEANRRFNEAHALVISGLGTTDGRELARIHIRRAEMLCWKGKEFTQQLKVLDSNDKQKSRIVLRNAILAFDEAWGALERGELSLGGTSHSTYWWYRLLLLKLSCYGSIATLRDLTPADLKAFHPGYYSLAFRKRLHLPSTILNLVRDALIVGSGDEFRQFRVLDYAMTADSLCPSGEALFSESSGAFNPYPELKKDIQRLVERIAYIDQQKNLYYYCSSVADKLPLFLKTTQPIIKVL